MVAIDVMSKNATINKSGYKNGIFKNFIIGITIKLVIEVLLKINLFKNIEIGIDTPSENIVANIPEIRDSFR